jgi:hypothetical protein
MSGMRRVDRRTGATFVLAPEGLTVERSDGGTAFIPAPLGYSLSHFGEGNAVVARGESVVDGWRDWHFEADLDAGRLNRLGPAY